VLLSFSILSFPSTVPKKPQCTLDSDCSDSDKCIRSHCVEACHVDVCGVNALCNSHSHQAMCSCPSGYEGNPHIECIKGMKLHPEYNNYEFFHCHLQQNSWQMDCIPSHGITDFQASIRNMIYGKIHGQEE